VTQLYQAVQEAKLAAEAKSRFLSMVSHELRTPLTVLLGYNAFITNSSKLPQVAQLHQTVAESGDRLLSKHVAAALRTDRGLFQTYRGFWAAAFVDRVGPSGFHADGQW
jgi:K+-sensing histidine kinase KdpD